MSNRSTFIGSSDIAAIVGMDPYRTALDVYAEKTGKLPGFEGNRSTRYGQAVEAFIAECFSEETGLQTIQWDPKNRLFHDVHSYLSALPDYECKDPLALTLPEGILECKAGNERQRDYWEGSPPERHLIQVQWQLKIGRFPWSYICGFLGGDPNNLCIYKIEADHAVQEYLLNAAGEFWHKHILADTPPEQSLTYRDKKTLNKLLRSSEGEPREPDDYERRLLESLESVTAQIKEATESVKDLEEQKGTLEAKLKLRCQDAPILFGSKRYYAKMIEVREKVVQAHSYVRLMSSKVKEG